MASHEPAELRTAAEVIAEAVAAAGTDSSRPVEPPGERVAGEAIRITDARAGAEVVERLPS
jgi:hypothetical protein